MNFFGSAIFYMLTEWSNQTEVGPKSSNFTKCGRSRVTRITSDVERKK